MRSGLPGGLVNSLARVHRRVHPGRWTYTVTAKYTADNDDRTRITLSVEQRIDASSPDDAVSDGTSLIEAALELAFPKAEGWNVEPTDKHGPEVEAEGWD